MTTSLSWLRWCLPFYYLFHSRLGARQDKISWVLVHPLPVIYLSITASELPWAVALVAAICGLVAFQSLYEIGYIHNDVFTVKTETQPTLRLHAREAQEIERLAVPIVVIRLVMFVSLALLATGWLGISRLTAFAFVAAVVMVAFLIHNLNRSRINVASYAFLAAGRYAAVPLLLKGLDPAVLSAALLMMPVPRTIEHACKPKYGFTHLQKCIVPFTSFRFNYYLAATIAWVSVAQLAGWQLWPGLVLAYLLMYRLLVWVSIRRGVVKPTRHQAYENNGGGGG